MDKVEKQTCFEKSVFPHLNATVTTRKMLFPDGSPTSVSS